MTNAADPELYDEAVALLEPGDITLEGIVVHTDIPRAAEPALNETTRQIGDAISAIAADEETYIYAGEDDPRFSTGQFHGRRLSDDSFVWECQQLLKQGSFDLVFYWEATGAHDDIVEAVTELGHDVVAVTEDGYDA